MDKITRECDPYFELIATEIIDNYFQNNITSSLYHSYTVQYKCCIEKGIQTCHCHKCNGIKIKEMIYSLYSHESINYLIATINNKLTKSHPRYYCVPEVYLRTYKLQIKKNN